MKHIMVVSGVKCQIHITTINEDKPLAHLRFVEEKYLEAVRLWTKTAQPGDTLKTHPSTVVLLSGKDSKLVPTKPEFDVVALNSGPECKEDDD